jgi:hypothetical protein
MLFVLFVLFVFFVADETVPHPKRDLPVGALCNIYRQTGWQWTEKW